MRINAAFELKNSRSVCSMYDAIDDRGAAGAARCSALRAVSFPPFSLLSPHLFPTITEVKGSGPPPPPQNFPTVT